MSSRQHALRQRAAAEQGFSLVELLVVILIIGILAGIAIPQFLNQKNKGNDAEAKGAVVTAARAMEACASDASGNYANCDEAAIIAIEPTLSNASPRLTVSPDGAEGYEVEVRSIRNAAVRFTLIRENGRTERECTVGGQELGGCPNPNGPGPDW